MSNIYMVSLDAGCYGVSYYVAVKANNLDEAKAIASKVFPDPVYRSGYPTTDMSDAPLLFDSDGCSEILAHNW